MISKIQYKMAAFFLPNLSTNAPIKGEVNAPDTNPKE
jgi:hypothetical protein